ncbi:MAG: hypothetical protein QXO15_02595 [Nitrososphaerota archaeon]
MVKAKSYQSGKIIAGSLYSGIIEYLLTVNPAAAWGGSVIFPGAYGTNVGLNRPHPIYNIFVRGSCFNESFALTISSSLQPNPKYKPSIQQP